ncbi:E3 ubiquitin-protein ligase mib2 [Mactra antiquata]
MVLIKPGVRVIRGPDWQSKRQDGGVGHTGTIIGVPKEGSSDSKVTVTWDSGIELRYRAGEDSKYDLRVFDNATVGIKHATITCDNCNEYPVIGFRWKCGTCVDYDLCTRCYMEGKHELSHGFMRMEVEDVVATPVSPRKFAKRVSIQGIFRGATVMRGPHWKWKNDDGGTSEEGTVQSVETWAPDHVRGGVKVEWDKTKKQGTYRVGGEGCVDVIYTEEAEFEKYYIDHLPLVDVVNPGEIVIKNGDKVKVYLDLKNFKSLQLHEAYGNWDDGMIQCTQETGTVVRTLYEGRAARVQYEDGKTWTVNRQALFRIHSFSVQEVVTILENINSVRELQEGHGGWNDEMKSTLGQVGRIAHIDSDGDMKVKVASRVWIFSPVCLNVVEDSALEAKAPDLSKSEIEHDQLDDLKIMQRDMERVAGVLGKLLVDLLKSSEVEGNDRAVIEAAAKGDLERVKSIVEKNSTKVNATHETKTALQIASYEGKLDVVKYLLNKKADVNIIDDEGDTALHYAAYGAEDSTMKALLQHRAKINVQNKKGQTSLHITIGKGSVPCTLLLVKAGANVNIVDEDGDSPLHDCIIQKRRQNQLIDAVYNTGGPDFSLSNKKGFNVLQLAALKDCRRAVETILKKDKSVVDLKMSLGFTALHICAANDHIEIASNLLEAKADKDAKDNNARTPLIVAVTQNHKRVIELLITHGCDVNAQDVEGNTALHVAQISRALPDQLARVLGVPLVNDDTGIQISCMLVEARANIDLKNKKGQTPLDVCSDSATREFLRRLALSTSQQKLETTKRGVTLPTHWEMMDKTKTLVKVPLDTSNGLHKKEFTEVKNKFCRTLPQARIHSIERVQSKFLWEHYYFKRLQMETEYGKGCANELDLYHGTDPKNVDIICQHNLDHRLAGENVGTLFGQGTYFASEAKYSDGFTRMDENNRKCILQCRVLAGKWTYGDSGYKRPPPMDTSKPGKLYDCCVDNVDKPRIFCFFDTNQYYPEYVIQYE